MQFGNCADCNKYKYLKKDGKCPSCIKDDEEEKWAVIYYIPHMACRPEVMKDGLSEKEAKEEAKGMARLAAKPESVVMT